MKNLFLLILTILCVASMPMLAQDLTAERLSVERLPLEKRSVYMTQTKQFLQNYYGQLLYNIDNPMIQQTFTADNMVAGAPRYMPEFLMKDTSSQQFLMPAQYFMELDEQFRGYDIDAMEIHIDNVTIDRNDFFLPDIVSCYVIAEYDLTILSDNDTLLKRRCRAYCLFPNIAVHIDVKMLQVQPLKLLFVSKRTNESVVTEKPVISKKEAATETMVGNIIKDFRNHDSRIRRNTAYYDRVADAGFDGRRLVLKDNKYGFIDREGYEIVSPQYTDFKMDFWGALGRWYIDAPIAVRKGVSWGYLHPDGTEIVPTQYDWVDLAFLTDVTSVMNGKKYGAIDTQGNIVVSIQYEEELHFSAEEGITRTRFNGKYGFVRNDGKIITPNIYDAAGNFCCDRAPVMKDKKVGFINSNGDLVIPYRYKPVYIKVKGGLTHLVNSDFCKGGTAIVMEKNKFALIDKSGMPLTDFIYSEIKLEDEGGFYMAKRKNTIVFLDNTGREFLSRIERDQKGIKGW